MISRRTITTGVVALVAVAVGFFGIRALLNGEDSHTITAQFDNGAGLYEGNTVAVLGIPVGTITRIEPKGLYVEVTMEVEGSVDLPADAQAVAVSTSVLTDRHVELTPVYRGGDKLGSNAVLGLDRTKTPVEFDRLLAMADNLSVELQGDGSGGGPVADLLAAGAAATDGNGDAMRSALSTLSDALRLGDDGGAATANEITRVVDDLAVLTTAAAANDSDIREFGEATRQMSEILADANLGTGDTGKKINDILAQANSILTDNRDTLSSTLANAETVTRSLADYRDQLAEFLDVTPLLMDNAYNAIDQENGGARVHAQLEKVFFDGQLVKEVCNRMGLEHLGCATGTMRDFGPDFGIPGMLEGLAGLPR
ncbi:MAG: MCE family protein [Rhodococcus sp. (in: high G+C Gram-positive bacteria)]|uniref:MCE family protein n=1 Tax=Rhodococcus sp. TaxID=1831 RepID=UPI003BB5C28D